MFVLSGEDGSLLYRFQYGTPDFWMGDPVRGRYLNSWGESRLTSGGSGEVLKTLSVGDGNEMVDDFAISLSSIDDMDGDGVRDLVVRVIRSPIGGLTRLLLCEPRQVAHALRGGRSQEAADEGRDRAGRGGTAEEAVRARRVSVMI